MIQLRQISDADRLRLKTDPVALSLLESGGARAGQTLQYSGTEWYPGVTIADGDSVIVDLDGVEIVDVDGDGVIEPGDLVAIATEIAQLEFVQTVASDYWTIPHGLNRRPFSVDVRDTNHNPWPATVLNLDLNTVAVRFGAPYAGSAVLTFYLKAS